jgi:HSP20 family protein
MTTVKFNRPTLRTSNALLSSSPFASLFDEFVNPLSYQGSISTVPSVNISETNENYVLEFTAPGFTKEQITIEVEHDVLIVSGEYNKEESKNDKNYSRKEFTLASFKRSFTLPESVNKDAIKAKYENGLLQIGIPKQLEKPLNTIKQISID